MVCHCSMAGTKACDNCINNRKFSEYVNTGLEFHYNPSPVVKDLDSEYLRIIANLNQHIDTLRKENRELKEKLK